MEHQNLMDDFNSLPAEAQRQVADFIAFLKQRSKSARPPAQSEASEADWEQEKFIGMWRNRPDLEDSSAWVRGVRQREWDSA